MVEHFVTLFDGLFLPQGLALYTSMNRHILKFNLWIICIDDESYIILTKLKLTNVTLLKLVDYEDEILINLKSNRTKAEYCWTLTPFVPKFVFSNNKNIQRLTYLDADMWFRKNPDYIFKLFDKSNKSVLITDHSYHFQNDYSATSGQYCVQFIIFKRIEGEIVRKDWENKCIEWCYARFENGKFGDQKYLEHWPFDYPDKIFILDNKESILAPWNVLRFPYGNSILFHFHGLRIESKKSIYLGNYSIPKLVIDNIYKP
jgi:hypothetical protein